MCVSISLLRVSSRGGGTAVVVRRRKGDLLEEPHVRMECQLRPQSTISSYNTTLAHRKGEGGGEEGAQGPLPRQCTKGKHDFMNPTTTTHEGVRRGEGRQLCSLAAAQQA